jgi:hypothetical protein
MGYFRWPDQQTATQVGCALPPNSAPNANAAKFLEALQGVRGEKILVGTGDNFGPELFSRTLDVAAKSGVKGFKEEYSYDSKSNQWIFVNKLTSKQGAASALGENPIPMDNVACFFKKAGYDALVPGEYDFGFGPERLRSIARYLMEPEAGFGTVQMLGANLVIETSVIDAAPRVPDWEAKLKFSTDSGGLEIDFPDEVLPWLQHVKIDKLKSPSQVYICPGNKAGDPDAFDVPTKDTPKTCTKLVLDPRVPKAFRIQTDPPGKQTLLQRGKDYGLCVTDAVAPKKAKDPTTYCQRFSVLAPFFSWPDTIAAPDPTGQYLSPPPYLLKRLNDGREVAIFGVVDPQLTERVGLLNYGWINTDFEGKKTEDGNVTKVTIVNPISALRQALDYFSIARPEFKGTKILLAQMPRHMAVELSNKLEGEFGVVVSIADQAHATDVESVTVPRETKAPSAAIWGGSSIVLVPTPVFRPGADPKRGRLALEINQLQISRRDSCDKDLSPSCAEEWTYKNKKRNPEPLERNLTAWLFECHNLFDQYLSEALGEKLCIEGDPDSGEPPLLKLQRLTFKALQNKERADVVLLQKRDWFDQVFLSPTDSLTGRLQEFIDRIFFKGDFRTKVVITGKTLQGVMKQSKAFNSDDKNDLALPHQRNRGVMPLGIFFDSGAEEYIVNGKPVDPDALYSVILSDFVAAGDTGYAALDGELLNASIRPSGDLDLNYIGTLVCQELKRVVSKDENCRDERLNSDNYFDSSHLQPFDTRAGLTAARHFVSWARFWRRGRPSRFEDASTSELARQRRGNLELIIQKVSFGYDFKNHNRNSEAQIEDQFAGVTQPGITDLKRSRQLTAGWNVRVKYGSVFGLTESDYDSTDVRGSNRDVSENTVAFEGGWTPRLKPRTSEARSLAGLVSVRWQTELFRPIRFFEFGDDDKFKQRVERDKELILKLGLRLDNTKSWGEIGYQIGQHFNKASAYSFVDKSGTPFSCNVGGVGKDSSGNLQTFDGCLDRHADAEDVDSSIPFSVQTTNRREHGAFFNFHVEIPLPFGDDLTFTTENTGRVFFNRPGDVAIDTRYYDKWTQSLSIPLVGNFSLVPKFEYEFFQNKVNKNSVGSWQQTISFEYKMDWRKGLPFWSAVKYKHP